ncbi:hypothetical protein LX36DRAFT_59132 [Colletotrichum falcatum]|nr:hypothetical protein LX36DRAFT_59132 [Colletotrichum falcatum]
MRLTGLDENGVGLLVRASRFYGGRRPTFDAFHEILAAIVESLRAHRAEEAVALSDSDKARVYDGDTALRNLLENGTLQSCNAKRLARNKLALSLVLAEFADINTREKFGRTFLMVTAAEGDGDFTSTLLRHGAKLEHNEETDDLAMIWVDFIMSFFTPPPMDPMKKDVNSTRSKPGRSLLRQPTRCF